MAEWNSHDEKDWGQFINWVFKSKKKIPTPFKAMNWLYAGGNREGWATAICGVETSGKSLIAGACALSAIAAGHSVGILNLDMDYKGWLVRSMSTVGNLTASDFWEMDAQADFLEDEKVRAVAHKIRDLEGRLIINDDKPRRSDEAVEIIDRWGEQGVELLIVDYVQLLLPPKEAGARGVAEILDWVVGDLVNAGKRHEMAMILVCQLNRQAKTDQRPRLHHVWGGSAIERYCDVGIILDHTTVRPAGNSTSMIARCEKNRHLGRVPEWEVIIDKRTLQVTQGFRFTEDWRQESLGSSA